LTSTPAPAPAADEAADLRRRVVRGGTLAALGLILSQAISFVSFLVLARLAPPVTFGAYAAAAILLSSSGLFLEGGMESAVIQRPDRIPEAASTAFAANIVAGFLLGAVAAALAPLIGLFFHSSRIALASAVLAGTIPLNAAGIVPGALLRRRVSLRYALVQPCAALAYAVAAIVTLAQGLGIWGLVAATYATGAARVVLVWWLSRWRPARSLMSWEMWRSLSAYGRPVVFSSLLREIGFSGTTAFVGRALGTAELGRFRAAQRFVQQANAVVVTGTAYALLPALARIAADEARLRAAVLRTIRVVTLLVVPVSLVFIPLGSQFAVVLLGARWRGAGPIMMAMAGMGIALALDSISSEAFKATGRTDLLPRMHGLTAIVPLAFMFALFRLGGAGIGLAMTLGTSTVAAYAIRALGRVAAIPLPTILRQMRSAAAAGVVMLVAVLLLDRLLIHADRSSGAAGVGALVGEVVIAAVVYLAALALVSRRELIELIELVRLLRRRAG